MYSGSAAYTRDRMMAHMHYRRDFGLAARAAKTYLVMEMSCTATPATGVAEEAVSWHRKFAPVASLHMLWLSVLRMLRVETSTEYMIAGGNGGCEARRG